MKILVPITGAYQGRLRVRRSTGELDTDGLDRVLSDPSSRSLALAKQLQGDITVVHVDKGAGEDVLREAMSHGASQGILIEGASPESDASVRAATIADVYKQHGPFDVVIGPARSEFGGFSGTLAAVAGVLDLPCVVGATSIAQEGDGFRIGYSSIFGTYELQIPLHSVVLAGDVAPSYPTAWGIYDAHHQRGILRVNANQFTVDKIRSKRERIQAVKLEAHSLEEVDGATLVRRMRSRSLVEES